MWPFDDKKVTTVGTSVSRLLADTAIPDFSTTAIVQAIIANGDVVENQLEGMNNSIAVRAERMFSYGSNGYLYGLPSGSFHSTSVGESQLQAVLNSIEGQPVVMEYSVFGSPNILHITWLKLIRDYGYDPVTNKIGLLSIKKGTDVYLDNIEVVIPDALKTSYAYETVAQYGPAAASGPSPSRPITMQSPDLGRLVYPSPVVASTTATEDYGLVSFSWQVATPMPRGGTKMVTQSASMQILNNEYVETAGHYHVKYNVGAVSKYWIYQAGLGTYPSLDLAANQSEQVGQFFPLIHFRTGQQSLAADTASAGYKASAQMAKILGIGYDETIDAIHENPDIGSVMQSYLTLSVPAVSTNPLEQRYLYEFFDQLYESRQAASLPLTEVTSTPLNRVAKFNNANQSAIQISDSLIKTSLTTTGILKQRKAGTIGAVGSHAVSFKEVGVEGLPWAKVPQHTYQRQVSEGLYDELLVLNLRMNYQITGNHGTAAGATDPVLLIPLDRTLTDNYNVRDREILYSRSLHMVFNTYQVTTLEWYEQEEFAIFLQIAAVVVLIGTLGQGFAAAAQAWATATTIQAGVLAVLEVIALVVIKQIAVAYAVKLFVKLVGVDVAVIVALVTLAVGSYNSFAGEFGVPGMPTAKALLAMSTSLTAGVNKAIYDDIAELRKEMELFAAEYKKDLELLEQANALLENQTLLQPMVIFGEKPADYYNRTVHSGNIGTMGIEALHSYVDIALGLPQLPQSFGDTSNEA